jgi:hypothetical protein
MSAISMVIFAPAATARGERIDVLDAEMDRDRRALERFRSEHAAARGFIDQHHLGIADADARVHEFPVLGRKPKQLRRVEGFLVELDGISRARANKVGRHGAHPLGNGLYG